MLGRLEVDDEALSKAFDILRSADVWRNPPTLPHPRPEGLELHYNVVAVVFGIDGETGRLYALTLPPPLASATLVAVDEGVLDSGLVREVIGFDLQPWEASEGTGVGEGVRVRVRGDLVVEVLEKCSGGCRLHTLPAALRILDAPGARARVGGFIQRQALSLGLECRRALERPWEVLEALAGRIRAPPRFLDSLERLLDELADPIAFNLAGASLYINLRGCRAKLKVASEPPSILVVYEGLGRVRRVPVDFDVSHLVFLVRRAAAALALEEASRPVRFEATINDTHRVSGFGVAAIASDVSADELRLPTLRHRVLETIHEMAEAPSRRRALRGLVILVAAGEFYMRRGDLYAYLPEGRLSFSHPEHGETFMDLGGPAVVRVTVLNSAPRTPPAGLRGLSNPFSPL